MSSVCDGQAKKHRTTLDSKGNGKAKNQSKLMDFFLNKSLKLEMNEETTCNSCFTCLCLKSLIMILMNPLFDFHAMCNYTPKWQAQKVGFLLISFDNMKLIGTIIYFIPVSIRLRQETMEKSHKLKC